MLKRFIHFFFLFAVVWLIGFGAFVVHIQSQATSYSSENTAPADGIVVLTGGNMRVAQGLVMLYEGKAEELLISGVSEEITLQNLLDVYSANSLVRDVRTHITLGYEATNTRSNVSEAYVWASEREFEKLIIVTAHYHMPRAMLLFKKHMPKDVAYTLIPKVVIPSEFESNSWMVNGDMLQLLVREYNKFLITYVVG